VLVVAGLARHRRDGVAGDVRRVDHEQVDPTAQVARQRGVEVAGVHPLGREVAPSAGDGRGVGVRGVHLGRGPPGGEHGTERPGAAAEVDDQLGRLARGHRDDQLAAPARDEHARVDGDPQARERRPPHDLLQRLAGHPSRGPGHQLGGRGRLVEQQPRLLLGEDTAGRAERGDELGLVHTTCPRRTTAIGSRSTPRSATGSRG